MPLAPYQFNELPKDEQIALLEDAGVYLEVHRLHEGCKVALFQLFGFYVEVYLHLKTDRIIETVAFNSSQRLDLYLDQVNITQLLLLN